MLIKYERFVSKHMPSACDTQEFAPGFVRAPTAPAPAPWELTIWDFKENGTEQSCSITKTSPCMETSGVQGVAWPSKCYLALEQLCLFPARRSQTKLASKYAFSNPPFTS